MMLHSPSRGFGQVCLTQVDPTTGACALQSSGTFGSDLAQLSPITDAGTSGGSVPSDSIQQTIANVDTSAFNALTNLIQSMTPAQWQQTQSGTQPTSTSSSNTMTYVLIGLLGVLAFSMIGGGKRR